MLTTSCFKIGFIQKTHGLKGEVTVSLDNNAPEDLSSLKVLFLGDDNRLVPYFIAGLSLRDDKAFVKMEEVDSIEMAKTLVGKSVYLEKSVRPKRGRGEFYDDEVTGFTVVDSVIGTLGLVREVTFAGSNRLLVTEHEGKEVLIPVNSPFITSVNKTKRIISVTLPEGFLDI